MAKTKIAILFGGKSSEHSVSCISAYSVITNLDTEKYEIYMIGITKGGRWLLFEGNPEDIKNGRWEFDNVSPAIISPDTKTHGIMLADGSTAKIDVVFPVLHGIGGEDGTVQGLLELAGIPYIGCGIAASANCMDKVIAKSLFADAQLPQCEYVWFSIQDLIENKTAVVDKIESTLCYPVFIKPSRAGSSIGIGKAKDRESLVKAINEAAKHDNKIIAERCVDSREIEVAVMGNNKPSASRCGEIMPSNEFYDYNAKYVDNKSGLAIPADLSQDQSERIRELAVKAYKAADCQGFARVDFFIERSTQEILLNEINTIPGFTDISMFPKLEMDAGYTYPLLLDELCRLALEKGGVQ